MVYQKRDLSQKKGVSKLSPVGLVGFAGLVGLGGLGGLGDYRLVWTG